MFKNIRRNSKQFISTGRRKSAPIVTPDPTPASTSDSSSKSTRTTFFELPAELRNVVYKQIAEETKILVPIPLKKAAKTPPPIPSLMLASKQTRQEFIPLLLEHGTIAFQIKDWDFQPLIRLLRSLYSTELKSLRCNGRLRVCIWLERMDDSGPDRLRKWLVFRSQGLDRLALGYGVVWGRYTQIIPTSTQVQKVNVFMQRRMILGQGLNAMADLEKSLDESLQFELQPIRSVLIEEERLLGADPHSAWEGNTALMMYGIPIRSSLR